MLALGKLVGKDSIAWWSALRLRARLRQKQVTVDRRAILDFSNDNFSFGTGTTIGAFSYLCVGPDNADPRHEGRLSVGRSVYIGQWNNIRAAGGTIEIGDFSMVSQMVSIIATDHQMKRSMLMYQQPLVHDRAGVTIGKDVWLGTGCTILPGVRIGDGAVIAAGAVVRQHVADYTIYAGVPARQIGKRED